MKSLLLKKTPQQKIKPGRIVGRLKVVDLHSVSRDGLKTWLCECVCGNTRLVTDNCIRAKKVLSCGCAQREKSQAAKLEKSMHRTWQRITGGFDGDTVLDSWGDYDTFCNVMGSKQEHKILRRHDPQRGYVRGNCYWGVKPDIIGEKDGPCTCGGSVRSSESS